MPNNIMVMRWFALELNCCYQYWKAVNQMGKFLKGNQLNAEIENLIDNAEEFLVLISPFIKLHSRFKDALKPKIDKDDFHITVVFGKNKNDLSKSLNTDDLEFLKEFPNIEIRYESRLHAKYYANESTAVLSSMNLYDFSQNNNIEFGILTKSGKLINDDLDADAYNYFDNVINNSQLLFHNEPIYESKLLGLTSKYLCSEIKVDELHLITASMKTVKSDKVSHRTKSKIGYCIRTGKEVPFNLEKPYSYSAFKQWDKSENSPEKFCHYSGEASNGETTFSKPILRKHWNEAKKKIADL